MIKKEKKRPMIRFEGFTEDWEQRKLKDVAPLQRGFDLPTTEIHPGNYPVVMSNGIGGYHSTYKVNGPGVVTGRSGTIGKLQYIEADYWPHNTTLWVTNFYGNNPKYIYYLYQNLDLSRFTSGSGVPTLNRNDVHDFWGNLPSVGEQLKIEKFMTNLDNLIALHQRKLEQLQTLKEYFLQNMFPAEGETIPKIRFKGFTDNWKLRTLKEIGKATGGTSLESEFSSEGEYKVINIGSYCETNTYRDQGIRAIKSLKTEKRVLNRGDITMILNDKTASGNIIGRVLLIEQSDVYVYNQRTERIEINHQNYNALFIYEMLNAPCIREKIIKKSQGNTQIYVNWSAISQLTYYIPEIEEQEKIGLYFKNLDNRITLHQHKIDQLQALKKFMLQNLFI